MAWCKKISLKIDAFKISIRYKIGKVIASCFYVYEYYSRMESHGISGMEAGKQLRKTINKLKKRTQL